MIKINLQFIKKLWKGVRNNWKTKYKLVIKNENTHEDKFVFRLSPRNIFVGVTVSAFVLITFTAFLIAFTPLRVYVPGYTSSDEYHKYRELAIKLDSLEMMSAQNTNYMQNFQNIVNEIVSTEGENQKNETDSTLTKYSDEEFLSGREFLWNQEESIIQQINDQNSKYTIPLTQRATFYSFTFTPPTVGLISTPFNISEKHYGIDIENKKETPISAIADGIVLFAGLTPDEGNVIILQHTGDIISVYKNNGKILKKTGNTVKANEHIALMGNADKNNRKSHLHFEIWYNGHPLNPTSYISIN